MVTAFLTCVVFSGLGFLLFPLHPIRSEGLFYLSGLGEIPHMDTVEWWRSAALLHQLAAFRSGTTLCRIGAQLPAPLRVAEVSPDFFDILDLTPHMGRFVSDPGWGHSEAEAGAVLSYRLWLSSFAGSQQILGEKIAIGDVQAIVVAVAPSGVSFPGRTDIWITTRGGRQLPFSPSREGDTTSAGWITRTSGNDARRSLEAKLTSALGEANRTLGPRFQVNFGERVLVSPLAEYVTGNRVPLVLGFVGACIAIMLAATANSALLLLSHALSRRREFAIRKALGANRRQVASQLVREFGPQVLLGALLGVWATIVLGPVVTSFAEQVVIRSTLVEPPAWLPALTAGIGVIGALSLALAPMFRVATREGEAESLSRQDALSAGEKGRTTRTLILCLQATIAVFLLTIAMQGARTFAAKLPLFSGFDLQNTYLAEIELAGEISNPATARIRYHMIMERLRARMGMNEVALSSQAPLGASGVSKVYFWAGDYSTAARLVQVSDGYFDILRIPLLAGRIPKGPDELAVSEGFRKQTGLLSPGQMIRLDGETQSRRIVGVLAEKRLDSGSNSEAQIYLPIEFPYREIFPERLYAVAKCAGCPAPAALSRSLDTATERVYPFQSLKERIDAQLLSEKVSASLTTWCAGFSLMILAGGIFSAVRFLTIKRRMEAAVHWALGASLGDIAILLLSDALAAILLGVTFGALVSAAFDRILRSEFHSLAERAPEDLILAVGLAVLASAAAVLPPLVSLFRAQPWTNMNKMQ